jgi:hypothetical protein
MSPSSTSAGDSLLVAHDQHMLVPFDALRRMQLAIACLGDIQQRPGSDSPQSRVGVHCYSGLLHPATLLLKSLSLKV